MKEYICNAKLCLVVSLCMIAMCFHAYANDTLQASELSQLSIQTQSGVSHKFEVEVAKTADQQRHGLMFRNTMPKNQGMLFIYDEPKILSMWMKNTYIPLDMLFVDKNGKVINIIKETTPLSLEVLSSSRPAVAVLEINAGVSEELSIQAGDAVLHSELEEHKLY